ncbi:MAG: ATP-binding cassette domain-containing protein [Paludibacteraceae bacterium]|nr:ATP-binding cassette domain-containing protein [Paludibacteraceae bacterium]
MSVEIAHLSKSIGKTHILRDINLNIAENGVVGLLGPNGAGKSTLMKCLTGLWDFQQGEIAIDGIKAVAKDRKNAIMPHEVALHIGYLPENNPLYEDMYVREYLQFMLSVAGDKRVISGSLSNLLDMVGLTPMANKRIRELSKGYRQRVGLAQAISADPGLLILDEPTTGLDPNQLDEIRALIRRLGQDRIVILSTHILQEIQAMCNRVIILSEGQIRYDSTDLNNIEEIFRERTRTSM